MQFRNVSVDTLNSIKPNYLKNYILGHGWKREAELGDKFFIYRHIEQNRQLLIPKDVEFDDYHRRVSEALELIALVEARAITSVINDVFSPEGDIIRFRLAGQDYEGGTAPLTEGLNLISGSRKSLYVSALQVKAPKKYYKRLKNSDAEEFLNSCRLGQTERGSFISTLVCPIGLHIHEHKGLQEQGTNKPEAPSTFTRKVTANLMQALGLIKKSIDDDDISPIQDASNLIISSNFCDAISEMRPTSQNAALEISVKFSTRDLIPQVSSTVSFRGDYFSQIEQIGKELRPEFEAERQTIFGKIDVCQGHPNDEGKMEGDVILTFIDEDVQTRAKVNLKAEHYEVAVRAHGENRYVKLIGEYMAGHRLGKIESYSEFSVQG